MSKNEMLQQYFQFDVSDLQENRQGRVSETQRARVKNRVGRYNLSAMLVVMLILIVAVVVLTRVAPLMEAANLTSTLKFAAGPILSAVLVIGYLLYRTARKSDMSLQKVEGPVNFVWVEDRVSNQDNTGYKTVRSLQMRVGGVSFHAKEALMDIINQGDTCRFYYTGGGDIVSAEFIDKTE